MREIPRPYEVYRHFKGNTYQILTLAKDSEDGESMVVYQALYGSYTVYVRSLEQFMEPVDKDKYPDAAQTFRFEKVEVAEDTASVTALAETETTAPAPAAPAVSATEAETDAASTSAPAPAIAETGQDMPDLDPLVLEFLDADGYQQKLNILASLKHRITDDMINTLAIASDIEIEKGPIEKRYESLKNCLLTKERFERVRLR